ncbi:MAG: heavy-metal-associated domain-containing protein [Thermoleophilia bacterium]|nr:heavy-metal-associated domain-containing protein [Thermoleophilia bacterium]
MPTTTLGVEGLTCGHCSAAVIEECSALEGVDDVRVDLTPGGRSTVTIVSQAALAQDDLAAAIDEAGDYRLVSTEVA